MRHSLRLFAVSIAALLGGCAGPNAPSSPPSTLVAASSSAAPASPEPRGTPVGSGCESQSSVPVGTVVDRDLVVGGYKRTYRLGLPTAYDGSTRAPVVIGLHGAGQGASTFASLSGLEPDAWARGFVTVLPYAQGGQWSFGDETDLDLIEALIGALDAELCVDPKRVFLAGLSQGGDFAGSVVCRRPGLASAIATAGMMNAHEPCPGWVATPLLAMIGSNDPIYLIEEGLSDSAAFSGRPEDRPGPLDAEIGVWAGANACDPLPVETAGAGDARSFALDCPTGADVTYLVHDGGHVWPGALTPPPSFLGPGAPDIDGNGLMLDFFENVAG